MSRVVLPMAEVIEISDYLDHLADRLTEEESGVAIGPAEASHLSAQAQRYAKMLLRWNR
jgi:hypothetical protein